MDIKEEIDELKKLKQEHEFFVGVDSDGCAFDTMEIKHKECFIPNIIKYWGLQPVSKYAREAAEFVNLYSKWRGINRFPALVMVFDLLEEREEVKKRKCVIPRAQRIREFIDSGVPLGNPSLKEEIGETHDPELEKALEWSEAVNRTVADIVSGVPPFPFVRQSLEKLNSIADIVVVSATPAEALRREWKEHNIDKFTNAIAGQEMGSKKEHLSLAAGGKYGINHILMIGDAPGDMKAAKANGALFYPVIPGEEEQSWEKFYNESIDIFVSQKYAGEYEDNLVEEFLKHLPEKPPWKK